LAAFIKLPSFFATVPTGCTTTFSFTSTRSSSAAKMASCVPPPSRNHLRHQRVAKLPQKE
jgi:hypothetical protein